MFITIAKNWDKQTYGIGKGWDYRTVVNPSSIIVHTTNGKIGTKFEDEVKYIATSSSIGAHFVIAKDGRIVQTLDPKYRAWHAGKVRSSLFNNNNSIGIEVHYTPGEGSWTDAMHTSLTSLCLFLINAYSITDETYIETHRNVAIPPKRKIDPSGFPDEAFYPWRSSLFTKQSPALHTYKILFDGTRIRSKPTVHSEILGVVSKGTSIQSDSIVEDITNEAIQGITTWVKVHSGGYIHSTLVKIL